MTDKVLTKDADALICVLYKAYLQRRKDGTDKFHAKLFGGSPDIHENLMPKWSFEDVDETCRELCRARYIDVVFDDDIANTVILSDVGIIYMENRFVDGLSGVIGYLERIKGIIPFL